MWILRFVKCKYALTTVLIIQMTTNHKKVYVTLPVL